MNTDIPLAKWRAGTSAEARERVQLAMDAYDEAIKRRKHKGHRLQARQARLPFPRQARADFAMYEYLEAIESR